MSPGLERTLVAWPLLASELLIFGSAAFVLVIAPADARERHSLMSACLPWWRGLSLAILSLSPLGLLVEASAMAGVPFAKAFPLLGEVMGETHVGRIWAGRLSVALLLAVAAWLPERQPVRKSAMFCITAGLLALDSLSSHAIDHGAPAVVAYFLHQAAAGFWIGSLFGLCLGCARRDLGDLWVERTAPRVSRYAGWSVAILIITGVYNSYEALGMRLDDLVYSAYGRTLLIKLWLFAVILTIAAYNRYRLVPAVDDRRARALLLRSVSAEVVLIILVIGVAALLANTPPAHHM